MAANTAVPRLLVFLARAVITSHRLGESEWFSADGCVRSLGVSTSDDVSGLGSSPDYYFHMFTQDACVLCLHSPLISASVRARAYIHT